MLALQEAQAKLPFENLQRNLRLIDIQAQQKRVAGGDEATIETERLAARQAAFNGTLTEQAGAIGQGQLFKDVGSTPEELIKFLNERAEQSLAIQQFQNLIGQMGDSVTFARMMELALEAKTYKDKIPSQIYDSASGIIETFTTKGGLASLTAGLGANARFLSSKEMRYLNSLGGLPGHLMRAVTRKEASVRELMNVGATVAGVQNLLGSYVSEVTSDTSIAENLLSVIEQSQQTQLEISANTKKTAENTALQLEKDRGDAFIDIARGGLAQGARFGSFLSPAPLSLSSAAASLSLSSSIVKSIDEQNLDRLEALLKVSKDIRALLTEIAINTSGAGGDSTGFTSSELLALMSDFKSRS